MLSWSAWVCKPLWNAWDVFSASRLRQTQLRWVPQQLPGNPPEDDTLRRATYTQDCHGRSWSQMRAPCVWSQARAFAAPGRSYEHVAHVVRMSSSLSAGLATRCRCWTHLQALQPGLVTRPRYASGLVRLQSGAEAEPQHACGTLWYRGSS